MPTCPSFEIKIWVSQRRRRVLCYGILRPFVTTDRALARKRFENSYAEEEVNAKRQIAALGKRVHHQEGIHMQAERIREEEDDIAV